MPTQYADLDELVLTCRSEEARSYIREAVLCYRAGAFRASIISIWIAVVYDFVDKFRELSLDGDKQADALIKEFEAIHKNADVEKALEFERTLLSVCRDTFDLLTPQEWVDLERLQKDRNRCAHPNLIRQGEIYNATPELAQAHLRNAVEHVLQRPPKVGKSAIDQLFKEVQSDYFPIEAKKALEVLKVGPLGRPKENLFKEFILGITSTALKGDLSNNDISKRFAAIQASAELHREMFIKLVGSHFPKLFAKTPDPGLKVLLVLLALLPELDHAIEAGLRAKLQRCVERAPPEDLNLVLTAALRTPQFQEAARERVKKLNLDAVAMYVSARRGPMPVEILERALELYGESGSFADGTLWDRKCSSRA